MDYYRLFFLFNDGKRVRAYHAEFPNYLDDYVKLQFHGPHDFGSPRSYGELVSAVAAEPVFDSQALQVIYATNTKHNDKEGKVTNGAADLNPELRSAINVWTIGRHAAREKVERTALRGKMWIAQPSVVLEGGVISASVLEHHPREDRVSEVHIAQKEQNATWKTVVLNNDSDGLHGHPDKLFSGTRPKMEYLYHLTPLSPPFYDWFNLNTIRSANFRQLSKDQGLSWQTTQVHLQFEAPGLPAHAFSEDAKTGRPRLLLFSWRENSASIKVQSIPLRADGSFERNGVGVELSGTAFIDLKSPQPGRLQLKANEYPGPQWSGQGTNLGAFVLDTKLLLVWTTEGGLGAIIGELDDNGTVPDDWKWSTVTVDFDIPFQTHPSEYSFNGVIVSSDFIS